MKKMLIALFAALVLGFGYSQTAMVTGSYLGDDRFSGGVELSTAQTGPVEGLAGVTLDVSTVFVYGGLRYELADLEDDGHLYTALRVGAFNPLDSLVSAPDGYTGYLGLGGLNEHSMVEGGVRATTEDFSDFDIGFVLTVGLGAGR